mmetsp:Transcript_1048/g.1869  ORF Transcript_1048/g.1869 Transcript_1048/m.1869 type:complete len:225 (-) Transcript_1048:1574-2248(-)
MGNLLVAPITDKETHRGQTQDGQISFAVSSMQGWRVHMEDAHILQEVMFAEEPIHHNRGEQGIAADENVARQSCGSSENDTLVRSRSVDPSSSPSDVSNYARGSAIKRAKRDSDGDGNSSSTSSSSSHTTVDTTGAGDAFQGGFLTALWGIVPTKVMGSFVRGECHDATFMAYALRLGTRVASKKIEQPGARQGLPYYDDDEWIQDEIRNIKSLFPEDEDVALC